MAYATKADIEIKYGDELTEMVVDHYREATEQAEDALNAAIEAGQDQSIIDSLTATYTAAQASEQTKADATINQNLTDAAARIDGYIKTRYPYTWTTPPSLIKSINIDLAVYEVALSADWRTDEMAKRAKTAVETLEMIRDGLISLTDGETEDETAPAGTTGPMIYGTWSRR